MAAAGRLPCGLDRVTALNYLVHVYHEAHLLSHAKSTESTSLKMDYHKILSVCVTNIANMN